VNERLATVPPTSMETEERAEQWWTMHRPRSGDARPATDVLLKHEGRELRIGPRMLERR
jgi:hypothetical protein